MHTYTKKALRQIFILIVLSRMDSASYPCKVPVVHYLRTLLERSECGFIGLFIRRNLRGSLKRVKPYSLGSTYVIERQDAKYCLHAAGQQQTLEIENCKLHPRYERQPGNQHTNERSTLAASCQIM